MDWTQAASSEGAYERLPEGYHKVKVVAAHRQSKEGKEYETAKGPYVSVIFEDANGSQAKQSFWLSDKAGWRLAKALKHMGANLEKMTAAGITLEHFHNEAFCQKQLVGRECWVKVTHSGDYANADVVDETDVPPASKSRGDINDELVAQFDADDPIPF